MASKGPKSEPSKTTAKGGVDVPPVPFVMKPAPMKSAPVKPVAEKPASKPIAKPPVAKPSVAKAVPVSAEPKAPARASVATETDAPTLTPSAPSAVAPTPHAPASAPHPIITPTPAIASATAVLQKEVSTMEATINTAADTAQSQAKTMFADVNDRAKTAMEKGSQMIAEMNEFSKGNLEAVVESSKIAAKGAEDIARYTSDYVRTAVEKANANASQFASLKSPTEFFKLHSELTKQAMDSMMSETAKFTEGYVKLLGEIAQPISNRVAVAVEKVKVAA